MQCSLQYHESLTSNRLQSFQSFSGIRFGFNENNHYDRCKCALFLVVRFYPFLTQPLIWSFLSHTESSTVRISGIGLRAHAGCCWFGVQAKPVKSTCRFVWPQLYIPCRFWMGYNHTFNSFDDNPAVAHPLIFFCLEDISSVTRRAFETLYQ